MHLEAKETTDFVATIIDWNLFSYNKGKSCFENQRLGGGAGGVEDEWKDDTRNKIM